VNGDGFADVIVGTVTFTSFNMPTGGAQLYLGGPGGLSTTPIPLTAPVNANEVFGSRVACAGDVNGDGLADVIVGSQGAAGTPVSAYVYLGGAGGLSATPAVLTVPSLNAAFGESVASAGDVNADGFDDVIVAPWAIYGGTGAVHVYLGGKGGLSNPPLTLAADQQVAYISVAGAGDVNGDGLADVLVGTIVPDGVLLYLGNANGLSPPTAVIDQYPDGLYKALFGYSVASASDVIGEGWPRRGTSLAARRGATAHVVRRAGIPAWRHGRAPGRAIR
jgi:hypothetical protein